MIHEFEMEEGVKQGCRIKTDLFKKSVSELEMEMKTVQSAGANLGKERICTVS